MTKMIPPAPTSAVMMPTPKQKIGFSIESIVGNDAAPSTNSSSTTTTTTQSHTNPPQTDLNNLTMSPTTSPTTQLHHHIGHLQHHTTMHQHHHFNHHQILNQTSPKTGDIHSSTSPIPTHQNQRPQDIQDIINRLQNTANNLVNNSNSNNNNIQFSSYSPPLHQTRLSPEVPPLALHLKRERSPPPSSHGNLTPPISTSPSSNTTPNPINLNCNSSNNNNNNDNNNGSNNYSNNNNNNSSINHSPSSSPNNLNHHHHHHHHRDNNSPLSTTTINQQSQNSPNSIGIPSATQIHQQFGMIGKGPIVVPGMPAGLIRPFPTVAGGPQPPSSHQTSGQPSQPDIKALPPYINSPEMVPPQHHNPHLLAAAQFQMAAALQAGHVLGAAAAGLPPHSPFLTNHPAIPRDSYPLYPWLLSRHGRIFPHRFPGNFLLQPFRKPKRIRTAFSPSQLLKLEHAFESNQYVVGAERKALAQSLNLSETQVKVWFQNRRTKHKRMQQEDEKDGSGGNKNCGSSDKLNSCDDSDDELIDMEMDDCPSDDELDASH